VGAAGIGAYSVKNKRYPNKGVTRLSGKHKNLDGGKDRKGKTMKKRHGVFFGFAVLLITAIFTLAGCDTSGGDDGNDPSLGETFTLNGKLSKVTMETFMNYFPCNTTFTDDARSVAIAVEATGYSGTTTATGGFSILIGKPLASKLAILTYDLPEMEELSAWDLTISPANSAKVVVARLSVGDTTYDCGKYDGEVGGTQQAPTYSGELEGISYMYVDSPVTITLKGKDVTDTSSGIPMTTKSKDRTLEFSKRGWYPVWMTAKINASMSSGVIMEQDIGFKNMDSLPFAPAME
jgi:hypothetical protein